MLHLATAMLYAGLLAACGGSTPPDAPDPGSNQPDPGDAVSPQQAYQHLTTLWPEQSWPPPVHMRSSRCNGPLQGPGETIHVGPGQAHQELTTVPWLSLSAGDVVNIHYRPEPYRTKFQIGARGTADEPVVINGVTSDSCERPHITGENAITAVDSSFPPESEMLGVIFLYRARAAQYGQRPEHVVIQNLKVTGASQQHLFTDTAGQSQRYDYGAAGIYAIVAEHISIDNCEISGNGTGVFFNSPNEDEVSGHVAVRNSLIHNNGNPGRYLEHNLYVQVKRSLFEGNHVGQLVPGAEGSSLKDRSTGTVVRFNRIDAAARALDLVENEGGYTGDDPLVDDAWVIGNLISSDHDRAGVSSSLLVHWGGDNDPRYYRRGTLHFAHNTVISRADQDTTWYISLFDVINETQGVDARANIFARQGNTELRIGYDSGTIALNDTNWLPDDWLPGTANVSVSVSAATITGVDPLLDANWRPLPGSPVIDAAQPIDPGTGSSPGSGNTAILDTTNLLPAFEYSSQTGMAPRLQTGTAADLGAFESR